MSKATNDPWAPQSTVPRISMPGDLDPRKLNVTSEEYIASLEAKLRKVQGKSSAGKEKQSRDMLKSLSGARESQMEGFLSDNNPFSSTAFGEGDEDAPQLSAIQKKLHPERQALTQGELKRLVDHDDLAKRVSALLDADKEDMPESEPFPFNDYRDKSKKEDVQKASGDGLKQETDTPQDEEKSEAKQDDTTKSSEATGGTDT